MLCYVVMLYMYYINVMLCLYALYTYIIILHYITTLYIHNIYVYIHIHTYTYICICIYLSIYLSIFLSS